MPKQILVVDDDDLLRRSIAYSLERVGYRVQTAAHAAAALTLIRVEPPDLILLDVAMPSMSGLDALPKIREIADIPVIFITARQRGLDEVLGLELGADDYISKPFDNDVLFARIRAVLRRAQSTPDVASKLVSLVVGDLKIDPNDHTVMRNDTPVNLSPREFYLLYALAQEAGNVLTSEELLARVWGAEFEGEPQSVYVYIRWLRQKLEDDPDNPCRIVTVRTRGYKLVPLNSSAPAKEDRT